MEYVQKQVTTQEPGERLKTASKQRMTEWEVDSNKLLDSKREMVAKSFFGCVLSSALDGSQNNMIHCAKELQ